MNMNSLDNKPGKLFKQDERKMININPVPFARARKEMSYFVYPFVNDTGGNPADRKFANASGYWSFTDAFNEEAFFTFYVPRGWELVSLTAVWHANATSDKVARCAFKLEEGSKGESYAARQLNSGTISINPEGVDRLTYTPLLGDSGGLRFKKTQFKQSGSVIHGNFERLGAVTEDTLGTALNLSGFIVTIR